MHVIEHKIDRFDCFICLHTIHVQLHIDVAVFKSSKATYFQTQHICWWMCVCKARSHYSPVTFDLVVFQCSQSLISVKFALYISQLLCLLVPRLSFCLYVCVRIGLCNCWRQQKCKYKEENRV